METQANLNEYGFNNSRHRLQTSEPNYSSKPNSGAGKKSFLVFNRNKYLTVPTETIAFFYVKYDAAIIVTFDKHEYSINYSLKQIEDLLPGQQFFRLNRQYLLNFSAIKEVEHYFARTLLVVPAISYSDKMIVSREKARGFLNWLENR